MVIGLRQLRDFVKLAESGSVTRAAEELFIAQPALSYQIKKLETALGIVLFERQARGVSLTEAGAELLPRARATLRAHAEFLEQAAQLSGAARTTLRVGFLAQGAAELMPAIVRTFTERFPLVDVELRHFGFDDALVGLGRDLSDVGFFSGPPHLGDGIAVRRLFDEPVVAVMAADHPLAARAEIDIAELVQEPFLSDNSPPGPWHDYWLGMEHRPTGEARIARLFASNDEWLEALRLGGGVSMCPDSIERFYGRPGLVFRPVAGMAPAMCGIAWREDRETAPVRDFVAVALELAATMDGDPARAAGG